jgi:hypothetical protein
MWPDFVLKLFLFAWPALLPLFYLRATAKRWRAYFLFLVVTLGMVGLVNIPTNMLSLFSAWWFGNDLSGFAWPMHFIKNGAAFVLSVWYLPRFRSVVSERAL